MSNLFEIAEIKLEKHYKNYIIKCGDEEEYIFPEFLERRWLVRIFSLDLWK